MKKGLIDYDPVLNKLVYTDKALNGKDRLVLADDRWESFKVNGQECMNHNNQLNTTLKIILIKNKTP